FIFFFQAEDGIRDKLVTGVQTCALPIWRPNTPAASVVTSTSQNRWLRPPWPHSSIPTASVTIGTVIESPRASAMMSGASNCMARSEERRVGKECRSRGSRQNDKDKELNH